MRASHRLGMNLVVLGLVMFAAAFGGYRISDNQYRENIKSLEQPAGTLSGLSICNDHECIGPK
jgi:hypothetical protein